MKWTPYNRETFKAVKWPIAICVWSFGAVVCAFIFGPTITVGNIGIKTLQSTISTGISTMGMYVFGLSLMWMTFRGLMVERGVYRTYLKRGKELDRTSRQTREKLRKKWRGENGV